MSRKPKAIRLSKTKAETAEVETETKEELAGHEQEPAREPVSSTKKTRKPKASKMKHEATGKSERVRSPRTMPAPLLDETDHDPFDQEPFMKREDMEHVPTHLPDMSKGIRWGSIMMAAIVALLSISFSLWTVELVEAFFARNPVLGWVSLGLSVLFGLALLALLLREFLAIRSLRKIGNLRQDAEQVLLHNSDATPVLKKLFSLYSSRKDMHWHLDEMQSYRDEVMDDQDKILLAETSLMTPLDTEAKQIIASTAKRVSVITALNPSAVLDIIFVGYQVISMLRKLMALYGGRPAFFAAMKLVRMVATHLAVTGGLAVSDTILQQVLGKGLAGTLSRKVGEGTVNGIMATRIGIAAIDLCRPLPFKANEQPTLKGFLSGLVGGKLG